MKSSLKRIVNVLLIAAIAATTVLVTPPVEAEAAGKMAYDKKCTVYLSDKSGKSSGYGYDSIDINNPSEKIKKSKTKSSDTSIVKIDSVENDGDCSTIYFHAKKAGKATITFYVGSKKCTTKITVKKYTNPAKTIKISGVNKGNNIACKFKTKYGIKNISLPKTTKKAKLKVKAASGWKLTNVYVWDTTNAKLVLSKNYSKGTSKQKCYSLGTLKKSHPYNVFLYFKNKKTGAYQYLEFYLNNYDDMSL